MVKTITKTNLKTNLARLKGYISQRKIIYSDLKFEVISHKLQHEDGIIEFYEIFMRFSETLVQLSILICV